MNKVILIGRLTKDPELKYSKTNKAITTFTLAVNRPKIKDEDNGVDFINIICFGKVAENVDRFLYKGSQVAIDGRLNIDSYQGEGGQRKYYTKVLAQSVKFLSGTEQKASSNEKLKESLEDLTNDFDAFSAIDDDIPF